MILIIGGAYQGKKEYAYSLLEDTAQAKISCADGELDSYEAVLQRPVINHFHVYIRRLLEEGKDPNDFAKKMISQNPSSIIIMDEIGSGIVPMTPKEREYRQTFGMIGQYLASKAEVVYRVICGIGSQIK